MQVFLCRYPVDITISMYIRRDLECRYSYEVVVFGFELVVDHSGGDDKAQRHAQLVPKHTDGRGRAHLNRREMTFTYIYVYIYTYIGYNQ